MQDLDDDVYDEIRGVASRNWMHGAAVSLAHLDQVKTTKYNLGLTDPTSLKAVGKNAVINRAKSEVENIETAPPISKHSSQQNAWGSNASVPDLIKQHTERQRLPKSKRPVRPESAKVTSHTRLPRGKRIRPQSAKDVYPNGAENVEVNSKMNIGVHGAKYDLSERLLEGSSTLSSVHSSVSSGWMVPPGVTDVTNKAIGSTINRFMDLDSKMSSPCLTEVDENYDGPPPPPRGSPDFLHMVDSDSNGEDSMVNVVDDMIEHHGHGHQDKPRQLLRRPTPEPIRFALPNADEDYDSDTENKKVLKDFEPSVTKSAIEQTKTEINGLVNDMSKVKIEPRIVEIRIINPYSTEEPETLIGGQEKSKRELHINENENSTLEITPRDSKAKSRAQSASQKRRPYSGRKELRYVKSRTDSGMGTTGGENNISSRPNSAKTPISKINVAYLSDSDSEGELIYKQTKPRKGVKSCDSCPVLSDGENQDAGDSYEDVSDSRPGSRPGSPSKQISGVQQNYYHLAMQVKPGKGPVEKEEAKPKTITTKTLALLGDHDRTVSEIKTVHIIDTSKVTKPKEYVAPRPPCIMRKQPSARPQSAKVVKQPKSDAVDTLVQKDADKTMEARVESNNAKNASSPTPDLMPIGGEKAVLGGNTSRSHSSSVQEPSKIKVSGTTESSRPESSMKYRKVPGVTREPLTCVALSKKLEESTNGRPESRLGYNEENLNSLEASEQLGILKRRRVTSAPPTRLGGTSSQTPELRFNLGKIRPHSAKDESGRGLHGLNHLTDHNHNRSYANYGHSSAMHRKPNSQPVAQEVNEIWTRREDFTMETEGVKECRKLQDKLIDAGVPVTLETLKRGLLPPTEYGFSSPAVKTEMGPSLTPNYSSGLLSKPEVWLAAEYKKLKAAEKKVQQATASLLEQEREERRRAESASSSDKKKKKKKGKSKKGKPKSANSVL